MSIDVDVLLEEIFSVLQKVDVAFTLPSLFYKKKKEKEKLEKNKRVRRFDRLYNQVNNKWFTLMHNKDSTALSCLSCWKDKVSQNVYKKEYFPTLLL